MTTQTFLGQQVRLISMSLLSALLLLSGLMPPTGASAAEERGLDLAAWCQKQGKEVILLSMDGKKDHVDAKSWRCAKVTYTIINGVEVNPEVHGDMTFSTENGISIVFGGSDGGSQSSHTEVKLSDITSIDMSEVCRDQNGDEWSAHIDDWSNARGWKCVRD